jgi:hypothetical protein
MMRHFPTPTPTAGRVSKFDDPSQVVAQRALLGVLIGPVLLGRLAAVLQRPLDLLYPWW